MAEAAPAAAVDPKYALAATVVTMIGSVARSFFGKGDKEESNDKRHAKLQQQLDGMARERDALRAQMKQERQDRAARDTQFKQQMSALRQRSERDRADHAKEISTLSAASAKEQLAQTETHLRDLMRQLEDLRGLYEIQKEEQDELVHQVHDERTKIKHFEEERNDPSIKNVVLIGMTGDGKSTFGNRLAGDTSEEGTDGPFMTSDSIASETQMVMKKIVTVGGQRVSVADTPGIADSMGHDREHINNVVSFLRGCGGVNQFVLVKGNANNRWSSDYQAMLRNFEHILGEGFWEFVTIVLSHVESPADQRKFEKNVGEVQKWLRSNYHSASGSALPVIASGHRDYGEVVQRLVCDIVPHRKYMCDNLTSPLEDLEIALAASQEEMLQAAKDVQVIETKVQTVTDKKKALESRIQSL